MLNALEQAAGLALAGEDQAKMLIRDTQLGSGGAVTPSFTIQHLFISFPREHDQSFTTQVVNRQELNTTLVVFSDRLKKARKDKGFKSQDSLANRLGVSQAAVSKWEKGKNLPEGQQLSDLAELFGVTTDWFLGRDASEPEVLRDAPIEPDLALWKRRALKAESDLADLRAALRELSSSRVSTGAREAALKVRQLHPPEGES